MGGTKDALEFAFDDDEVDTSGKRKRDKPMLKILTAGYPPPQRNDESLIGILR